MRRILISFLSLAALAVPTTSWAASTSANLGIAVAVGQAITAVGLSKRNFTGGAPSGTTVGTISVAMSPASPPFFGSLSLSGTNASSFEIAGANLETKGVVPAGTYQINVVATQADATGSPFTQPQTITGTDPPPPPVSSCPANDGSSGASAGTPQYPNLLNGYASTVHALGCKVAGVDYHVGIPSGTTLSDWQSISNPNVTVSGSMVRCTGAGAAVTFDKIDFSLHGGGYIYNGAGGCANITVTNSNFACTTTAPAFAMIIDQNDATLTIKYNKFNGANCGTPQLSTMISAGIPMVLEYNWFINSPQQVLDTGGAGTLEYHYNLLDNMVIGSGQHMNWLQLGGSGWNATLRVTFNAGYQTSLDGAEGFQFYSNSTPATLTSPVLQYNTMIALPSGGNPTMSYIVHGNCHSSSDCSSAMTTLSGKAINANNYFDARGAYGAYYPGTMTQGMGWTSSGNIDMNTGAVITPQ